MASEKITAIIESVKGLSVLELKELIDAYCEEFGVSAVAAAPVAAAGAAAPVEEEKSEFAVILTDVGATKMQVIKIVNEELTKLMGGGTAKIAMANSGPTVVMMVGLQGAGKTTTTAKLAGLMRRPPGTPPPPAARAGYPPAPPRPGGWARGGPGPSSRPSAGPAEAKMPLVST